LQLLGRRRWRIGRVDDDRQIVGTPLKLLRRFKASQEWLLEPGDMLYLPPGWGHDGLAVGECMTASVGFRSPRADELAHALLVGVADAVADADEKSALYSDRASAATATPALIPPGMAKFAGTAWQRATQDPQTLQRALGQWLSEPKARVWFEPGPQVPVLGNRVLELDRRSRMLYDAHHVYINGESLHAAGRDAQCLRQFADTRELDAADVRRLSKPAREIVQQWLSSGWIHER
jgi:50S ribosomal protein L16 3-hydroxylase